MSVAHASFELEDPRLAAAYAAGYAAGALAKAVEMRDVRRAREAGRVASGEATRMARSEREGRATHTQHESSRLHLRYVDELLTIKCGADLLDAQVFDVHGAAKELTEAFAAFAAVRAHLLGPDGFDTRDPSTRVLVVGDGTTPRAGATFALRTSWTVHSVDPLMRRMGPWDAVQRLETHRARVQDLCIEGERVIVVMVHCHVTMDEALGSLVRRPTRLGVVAAPCCDYAQHQTLVYGHPPVAQYEDVSMASGRREMRVWLMQR